MRRSVFYFYKRIIICLLCVVILVHLIDQVQAQESVLPLEEALRLALETDAELAEEGINLNQKRLELLQARHAVRDYQAKGEDNNLSTDLQYGMKIPEALKAVREVEAKINNRKIALRYDVENAYSTVVESMLLVQRLQERLVNKEKELAETKAKLAFQLATEEEVQALEQEVEELSSEFKVAQLNYKAQRLELGEKIGLDLEYGYTFESELAYVPLTIEMMWRFVHHAEREDFGLFNDREARKLAEEKVHVTRKLYLKKFGAKDMNIIEAMYRSSEIDYEQFLANYDRLLELIKKQWEGYILLVIPKSLFQGEYDGLRYFDDQKFSLPVSMLDSDKARLKERETKKKLITNIKKSYLDAKAAEENYAQSLKKEEQAKLNLNQGKQKLAFGLITADELKELEEELVQKEESKWSSYFGYRGALAKLNRDTSNAVYPYLRAGILPWGEIDDGLDPLNIPPEADEPYRGRWQVESVVEMLTSQLIISVDPALNVTEYALLASDGTAIGERLPIDEPLLHLSFIFDDLNSMRVKLYQDEQEVAEAVFDGYGSAGELVITLLEKGGVEP